ncbi:MAG: hypothetical protein JWR90_4270, partial [Marmoricola sp.]|nr:hypothetical protein [Marmoricola sp.]
MTEARERVLVVGAGGLGLLVASRLAADPEIDVAMVVREGTPEVVLTVAGDQSRPRVQLVSDPAEVGQVDWMIVATKAYDVQGLEEWFSAPGCAGAVIAVACSGVEALANVVSVAGERRTIVPLVVTSVSERTAPGE